MILPAAERSSDDKKPATSGGTAHEKYAGTERSFAGTQAAKFFPAALIPRRPAMNGSQGRVSIAGSVPRSELSLD
jgi:hypothetical protein